MSVTFLSFYLRVKHSHGWDVQKKTQQPQVRKCIAISLI